MVQEGFASSRRVRADGPPPPSSRVGNVRSAHRSLVSVLRRLERVRLLVLTPAASCCSSRGREAGLLARQAGSLESLGKGGEMKKLRGAS